MPIARATNEGKVLKISNLLALSIAAVLIPAPTAGFAQQDTISTYRGPVVLPDFTGRDRAFAPYRTRIVSEVSRGPNFAGRYALTEIGCGTSCRIAFITDLQSGRVYRFPYGGEEYYGLWLTYTVRSDMISAQWLEGDRCIKEDLLWGGNGFSVLNRRSLGENACDL